MTDDLGPRLCQPVTLYIGARVWGTAAALAHSIGHGIHMARVHDVKASHHTQAAC